MGTVDIILLVCFIPAVFQGIRKGFVGQAVSLVALLAGIWLAVRFNGEFSGWLTRNFNGDGKVMKILGFTALFLTGIIVLKIAGNALTKALDFATLGFANRLLGVVFSLFECALLLGLLICLFDGINMKWDIVKAEDLQTSKLYPWLKDFAGKIIPYLKELVSTINLPVPSGQNFTNV